MQCWLAASLTANLPLYLALLHAQVGLPLAHELLGIRFFENLLKAAEHAGSHGEHPRRRERAGCCWVGSPERLDVLGYGPRKCRGSRPNYMPMKLFFTGATVSRAGHPHQRLPPGDGRLFS